MYIEEEVSSHFTDSKELSKMQRKYAKLDERYLTEISKTSGIVEGSMYDDSDGQHFDDWECLRENWE